MQFYSYYRHNNSEIFLENADKKEGLAGGDALKIVEKCRLWKKYDGWRRYIMKKRYVCPALFEFFLSSTIMGGGGQQPAS